MSDLQHRYADAVMNTFGPPRLVLTRGEGAYVWDDAGQPLPRPARRHRGQRARPRPPGARRRGDDAAADPRPRLELLRHRAAGRARRAAARAARAARPRVLHQLRAPRPTRPPSSSPGAPGARTWSPPRAPSTAARWAALALTSQGRLPRAVRAAARRRHLRPVRRRGRPRGRGDRPDRRRRARAGPGRGRRRRPARRLPRRRPPDHRATTARCSGSTRCRPASAAPARGSRTPRRASSPTWSRWPRGSAAASPSGPASASAQCRRAAAARQPRHHVRRQPGGRRRGARRARHDRGATGCSTTSPRSARRLRAGLAPRARHRGARARGCSSGSTSTRPRRPRWPAPRWRRGFIVNDCTPERIRLAPPLVLTDEQVDGLPGRVADDPRRRLRHEETPHDSATSSATTT